MVTDETLSFAFAEDGVTLVATLRPAGGPVRMSRQTLQRRLDDAGYGELFLLDDGLKALEAAGKAADVMTVPIAEKRDAEVDLVLDNDGMAAYLTVYPPFGGRAFDKHWLRDVLFDHGILYGIRPEAVSDLTTGGKGTNVLLAKGLPPEHGRDAWFEPLAGQDDTRGRPKELPDGTVDFFELGTVVSVEVGQPLLRKHVPTEGTAGKTVKGEDVPARPGRDAIFGPMNASVALSETDPLLVVAATAGLPRYGKSWVKVEPILVLPAVDLSTGNIHFDGNVIVNGPVQAGLSVWAAGDIIVEGPVEAATLDAGGTIELRAGVIGQGVATLRADGNILARFVESATLESGQDVYVIDILLHSKVMALDAVYVQGGRKAQIIGGQTHATRLIRAAACGSPAGVPTELSVGVNPYFKRQYDGLVQDRHLRQRKVEELGKQLVYRKLKPDPAKAWEVKHLETLRENLNRELALLSEQVDDMGAKLEMAKNAKVLINDRVYGGVKVVIGDQTKWIKDDMTGCGFRLRQGEIVLTLPTPG